MTSLSCIYSVCEEGDENKVFQLIFKDAKIDTQDNKKNTPLNIAYKKDHEDIVIALMLLGADETISKDKRKTPADMCIGY